MKVSIITVSYNSEKTIYKTIESVREQTYPNVEYIVVDGRSTDATVDILKENEDVIDDWISEPDEGIYDAMNKGIRMSTGDIVGIINSDDWYEPQAVETAVRIFKKNSDVDLVHGAMNVWTEEGKHDARYGSKDSLAPNFVSPFNHPTCFFRRRVYKKIGGFAIDLPTAADYDFMLRFLRSGREDMYVDKVLANFRKGGVTTKYTYSLYSEIWRVLRRNKRGLLTSAGSLLFRGVKDSIARTIKYFNLYNIKSFVRRYAGYHDNK
jgi:glycosyltransferase involved in cell wall biosynthesis